MRVRTCGVKFTFGRVRATGGAGPLSAAPNAVAASSVMRGAVTSRPPMLTVTELTSSVGARRESDDDGAILVGEFVGRHRNSFGFLRRTNSVEIEMAVFAVEPAIAVG